MKLEDKFSLLRPEQGVTPQFPQKREIVHGYFQARFTGAGMPGAKPEGDLGRVPQASLHEDLQQYLEASRLQIEAIDAFTTSHKISRHWVLDADSAPLERGRR